MNITVENVQLNGHQQQRSAPLLALRLRWCVMYIHSSV